MQPFAMPNILRESTHQNVGSVRIDNHHLPPDIAMHYKIINLRRCVHTPPPNLTFCTFAV